MPFNRYPKTSLAAVAITFAATGWAADTRPTVDDFSNAEATSHGVPRFFITDTSAGGQSTQAPTVAELGRGVIAGVLEVPGITRTTTCTVVEL